MQKASSDDPVQPIYQLPGEIISNGHRLTELALHGGMPLTDCRLKLPFRFIDLRLQSSGRYSVQTEGDSL